MQKLRKSFYVFWLIDIFIIHNNFLLLKKLSLRIKDFNNSKKDVIVFTIKNNRGVQYNKINCKVFENGSLLMPSKKIFLIGIIKI